MPLSESKGNMYPWVTHTHTHLGGECPHLCPYCYTDNPRWGRAPRYTGPLRLIEDEFKVKYGEGRTIFIEHMNDLFAREVPDEFIQRIFDHCIAWPNNTYVFQTKNPERMRKAIPCMPPLVIVGTTIETNCNGMLPGCTAPEPVFRYNAMRGIKNATLGHAPIKTFVTVEPIIDFDPEKLARWIINIRPDFLNIGADSKNHNLPEPTPEKVREFIRLLQAEGLALDIREKHNLARLMGGSTEP
jgi:DNA repair photolyase